MSTEYSAIRHAVYERDGGQCVRCGCPGTEVSHRKRRREGGHKMSNCALACGPCHRGWAHQNPRAAMETGFMISVHGPDPQTVPLKTFYGWVLLTDDGQITPVPPPGATNSTTG
jgi:hypothetical protein